MEFIGYLFLLMLCLTTVFKDVSNESVNKEKTPVKSDVITDLSDLPTKFGDEDDVIKIKPTTDLSKDKTSKSKDVKKFNEDHFDHKDFDSNEENYDDNDEDFILSEHFPDKDDSEDSDYKNADYEEGSELGPTLDNFGTKFDGAGDGNELPIFLSEPQSTYVVRSRPAILKCKAAHALQVSNIKNSTNEKKFIFM